MDAQGKPLIFIAFNIRLSAFTKKVAALFNQASKVTYSDSHGSHLELSIQGPKDFTIVDGFDGDDMVPGEIAKTPSDANGHIVFTGTFLSLIPFALKHGLVQAGEFTFDIERHAGLHLGFGGAVHGTLHCDFLFQEGNLFCDDQQVYQNAKFIV